MEGGKRRTSPVRQVERSFECSRLAGQLLISAYERVVPAMRHAVPRDLPSVRSTLAAAQSDVLRNGVAARS